MASHLQLRGNAACQVLAEARCGGLFAQFGAASAFPEPGAEPVFAPDRGFEIGRIDLELDVDPVRRSFAGRARLQILPLPTGLGEVRLDLDDVELDAVEDEKGAPLAVRYGDGSLRVLGLPPQGGVVVVRYRGRPVRGLYFTGPTVAHPRRQEMAWTQCQDQDAHFIVPCLDHPGVRHPWGIVVRVDHPQASGFTVVSNGELRSREGACWTWEQAEAIPAYLLTVVVARLEVVEDGSVDGRAVRYLVPELDVDGQAARVEQVRRIFGRTPAMIRFLSQRLGRAYPWPRYDQVVVHDFIFGGMENVAATTLTDVVLTDDRAALDVEYDDLIVHELMHQWFGDLVTCQDWSQGWLNEGWATFSEQLWKEHAEGQERADLHAWNALAHYLDEDGGRYRRAIVSYRFREPIDVFDRHLYEKGSLVLRTLRAELGAEVFWAGTASYLHRYGGGAVHTLDFQRAMEAASGRSLDRFFRQWIWGAGHPELKVSLSHDNGLLQVQVEQGQTPGPVQGDPEHLVAECFAFDLTVVVVAGGVRHSHRLPVRRRSAGFYLPCPVAPERVEVDPAFELLADLSLKGPRDWMIGSLRHGSGIVARIRAARALAEEGSPLAIGALVAALQAEPFYGVRVELVGLLGRRGGEIAANAVRAALGDADPRVRRAAVEAMGSSAPAEHNRDLVRVVHEGDPSIMVEGAALQVLGDLVARADAGEPVLPTGMAADSLFRLLVDALGRASWAEILRQRAVDGLARTRRAEALTLLLELTGPGSGDRVRAAAASGLGRLASGDKALRRAAVDRLMVLARDPAWRVAWASISALGTAGDARASGTLAEIHASALEGRLRRTAFEASRRLSSGAEQPIEQLRGSLEKGRKDAEALRDRLDRLEARTAPATG